MSNYSLYTYTFDENLHRFHRDGSLFLTVIVFWLIFCHICLSSIFLEVFTLLTSADNPVKDCLLFDDLLVVENLADQVEAGAKHIHLLRTALSDKVDVV